ncbi:MAG: DUF1846 domain-containing protein [Clostridia bacterium]|nr:DUF1846 domain-containing protein [Clostridia bacterium]
MKLGFDNEKYVELQSEKIRERIKMFGSKLYLEFGGKLFDDFHASRVLPGFMPDSKLKMLLSLKEDAEVVIAINAEAIEKSKKRGDYNISYDLDALRLIDAARDVGLYVGGVVITQYAGEANADKFIEHLKSLGVRVYKHYPIEGYPNNTKLIVSNDGFGKDEFVETTRRLVVVTAPGPGSGKMAVCLSQLYHEQMRGVKAGYAKFETFPIWNLPLNHPVNIAYEAATADLNDINMIDPFHLEAYQKVCVNYNRDIEIFPVVNTILTTILGESPYKSPTDMGVNMAGYCITDDETVSAAAKAEIIRRAYKARCAAKQGLADMKEAEKIDTLMAKAGISVNDRRVVPAAVKRAEETKGPAVAIELPDGTIVTGKTTPLLGASAAALINAIKTLAGIDHDKKIIPPEVIGPIQELKIKYMGNHNPRLHTDEVLIALSFSAITNNDAAKAFEMLPLLKGCDAHATVILSHVDENVFSKLGVRVTCEPAYQTKKLYHAV